MIFRMTTGSKRASRDEINRSKQLLRKIMSAQSTISNPGCDTGSYASTQQAYEIIYQKG